jgi:4-amino-4-deoxy-L-arabinose transferase-like glycosyltransferase
MSRSVSNQFFTGVPAPVAGAVGATAAWPRAVTMVAFWALCLATIWFSIGDHPIYPHSESRYAEVSLSMARGSGWLVPRRAEMEFGAPPRPHLTKPPLTYWLEAGCIRLLGPTELAVRLPSAVAGSLTLVAVFLLCRRQSLTLACLATGTLSLMPLHIVLSRNTLTDGILALFWFGTLASGVLAVREPRRKLWPALLWASVALGLLTKGPVAYLPLALLVLWLGVSERRRDVRALRLPLGLALSALPLLAWIGAVLAVEPAALGVWWHEMADRVAGTSRDLHPEPWWFYLPIFAVGLFPATLMLNVPGLNFRLADARAMIRRADEAALWALAVVGPLVVFSLVKGKLPSYLLPAAAPLAILTGRTLAGWVDGTHEAPERPPEVVKALAAVCVAGFTALALLAWMPDGLLLGAIHVPARAMGAVSHDLAMVRDRPWLPLILLPAAAAAAWTAWWWNRRTETRFRHLAGTWAAITLVWLVGFEAEDALRVPGGNPRLIAAASAAAGVAEPGVVTFGFRDESLAFYTGRPAPRVREHDLIAAARDPHGVLVLAEAHDWDALERRDPQLTRRFEKLLEWHNGPRVEHALVLRLRDERPASP